MTAWANHFTLMFSAGVIESEKLWYAGSELLASDDSRINNYCYKPDYVNGCDVLRNKMAVRKIFMYLYGITHPLDFFFFFFPR